MARKLFGGLNLYQRKEPAFSREQRQLLVPEVLYIPIADGADEKNASAFMEDVIFLGTFDFDYPGVTHTRFGRYKMSAATEMSRPDYEAPDFDGPKPMEITGLDMDELIKIAKKAYIIDETDGTPLFKKLRYFKKNGVACLIADAIDEEPYVSSSINTLIQKGEQVMDALKQVAAALPAEEYFAVYYADLDDTRTVVPSAIDGVQVKKIGGKYPVRDRLGPRMKSLGKGSTFGLIGVQALLHLYRAIYFGKKQNTTIVTVAGDCIGYSCNVEVTIGTTLQELLEFSGLTRDPARVIIRGSMRGVTMQNLQLPVLHANKAVLAMQEQVKLRKLPCTNCGKCIRVCPAGLSPTYLYKYNKAGDKKNCYGLHPEKCLECGCCSYVCPARLELSDAISGVKRELREGVEQK